MPIETACTGCGRMLRVPDTHAGKQARCPQCDTIFTVPASDAPGEVSGQPLRPPKLAGWIINTADGDRYGPISRDELDRWVAEGRLTARCQLTRQGDIQSISAGDLYPQLGSTNPFAEPSEHPATGPQVDTSNPYTSPTSPSVRTFTQGGRYQQPHRGGMILTFGILGLLCCGLFGIAAWVMGSSDLAAMNAGRMDKEGYGLTQGGMIVGIIATIMMVVYFLLGVVGGFG